MSDIPAFVFCRCCGDPGCRNVWADWPPTARTKPSASNEQDRRLPTGCDCGNCDDEETPEWTV